MSSGSQNGDRMILGSAVVVALSALLCILYFDAIWTWWKGKPQARGRQMGTVIFLTNDARHREGSGLAWYPAQTNQGIFLRDALFSGADSRASVRLQDGGEVDLGANTMIVFTKLGELELLNLQLGNFRLRLRGHLKILIAGEITEFDGANYEVQVYLQKGKPPEIRRLTGEVAIKSPLLAKAKPLPAPVRSIASSTPPNELPLQLRSRPPQKRSPVRRKREVETFASQDVQEVKPPPVMHREPAALAPQTVLQVPKASPPFTLFRDSDSLWLGSGLTYMTYREFSPGNNTDVSYSSSAAGSIYADGKFVVNETWRVLGAIRNSPGSAKSGDSIAVAGSNYRWATYSAEGLYKPNVFMFKLLGRNLRGGLRFGIQHHSLPYISRVSIAQVRMENQTVSMATLGGQIDVPLTPSTVMEIYMRYQYPLRSDDSFKVSPGRTYDGSLGIMTMLGRSWALGGFWYGQSRLFTV